MNHLVLFVLISKSDEKSETEMKTKSKFAPDGTVTLENGFSDWNCNDLILAMGSVFKINKN